MASFTGTVVVLAVGWGEGVTEPHVSTGLAQVYSCDDSLRISKSRKNGQVLSTF